MTNIILVIMSIILSAGVIFATLSYLPSWRATSEESYLLGKDGFKVLDQAYKLYTQANSGVPPIPDSGQADGGLTTFFANYYDFLPKAPYGYTWSYGRNISLSLDYFCLHPATGSTGMSEGAYRGLSRLSRVFSSERYFIQQGGAALACGANSNAATPSSYPAVMSVTYFVKYVPGT